MRVTEFLLARIEEDALAFNVGARSAWLDTLIAPAASRRLLAECEAKRRVVELAAWVEDAPAAGYTERNHYTDAWATLRLLALPYADHPDYDEVWRP